MLPDDKKHQKALETKQRCHDALISIWNARKCTIDKVTVKEICAAAKISRNTFYYHYDDTYSLLQEIEQKLLEIHEIIFEDFSSVNLSSCIQGDPVPCIYDILSHIEANKPYYRALFSPYGDQLFIHKHKQVIKSVVKKKLASDNIQIDSIDVEFVLELVASSVIGAYQYWLFINPELSPAVLSTMFVKLVFGHFYHVSELW